MVKFILDNGGNPKQLIDGKDYFAKHYRLDKEGRIKIKDFNILKELQRRKLSSSDQELNKKINDLLKRIEGQEKKMGQFVKAKVENINSEKNIITINLTMDFKKPARYIYGVLLLELKGEYFMPNGVEFISKKGNAFFSPCEKIKENAHYSTYDKRLDKLFTENKNLIKAYFLVTSYELEKSNGLGEKFELGKFLIRQ
jgi:hypothetical protein